MLYCFFMVKTVSPQASVAAPGAWGRAAGLAKT
jgi:hypothetical protein